MVNNCHYCGIAMIRKGCRHNTRTKDHIIPKYYGGTFADGVVYACHRCNSIRGHAPYVAFCFYVNKLQMQGYKPRKNKPLISSDVLKSHRFLGINNLAS